MSHGSGFYLPNFGFLTLAIAIPRLGLPTSFHYRLLSFHQMFPPALHERAYFVFPS